MPAQTEVRPFLPIDVPLMHRLLPYGVTLDSAARLTRGINALEGAMLGTVPLADLGTPTFVVKHNDIAYVAQFRHKGGDQHAHIVYIAPELDSADGLDAWLHLVSAMVANAAKRGALTLNAEVEDGSLACEVLHRAGFATYARQTIWRRQPLPVPAVDAADGAVWRPAQDSDVLSVTALYASIVPRLVMQAEVPPDVKPDGKHVGWVHECNGKVMAYLSIQEGKNGIYLQPYLHPQLGTDRAEALLISALANLPRADKASVYICVRRYQSWLHGALEALHFEIGSNEAVMVKHTTARVEHPAFNTAYSLDRAAAMVYPGQRANGGFKRIDNYRESVWFNGISHNGRSGETEGRPASVSSRCAGKDWAI